MSSSVRRFVKKKERRGQTILRYFLYYNREILNLVLTFSCYHRLFVMYIRAIIPHHTQSWINN